MSEVIKTYDYTDQDGKLLYQNCRFEPRDFRLRQPDGNGEFIFDLKGVTRTLYRLPELIQASKQDFVFVVEGEKDADSLSNWGLTATTSGSSTSWRSEFVKYFKAQLVCIVPDNDLAGQRFAETIAISLYSIATEVRILNLPGLSESQDVSDWLDNGGSMLQLMRLVDETEPYEPAPDYELQLQVLSAVEPKTIEYLQPEIIPLGMITSIVSQEGEGKSTLASNIIAHVTQGRPWPNAPSIPNPKGDVILFNHEEEVASVLVPRLIANGADLDRVVAGGNVVKTSDGSEQPFDIERDIDQLDAQINKYPETRLVIFDPITSYSSCHENSNSEVRKALKPLVDFAARRNIAVLGLTHLNKKVDLGMINRTIGSRAWSAVPRMVWGIRTEQIEDEDGHKIDTDNRFLLNIKCNIGPKPKGLRFSIANGGRVIWDEERVSMSMDGDCGLKTSRIEEASDWLREHLGNKTMSSVAVFEDGEKAGFSRNLLYRAKDKLKIKPNKIGFGDEGQWFWELPKDD